MAVTCATTTLVGTAAIYIDGVTIVETTVHVGDTIHVKGFLKNSGTAASAGNHTIGLLVNSVDTGHRGGPYGAVPAGGQIAIEVDADIASGTPGTLNCCLAIM